MASRGGSKPGERRGGRPKGGKNKPRIVTKVVMPHPADQMARQAASEVRAAKADPKRCKDLLADFANLCGGIAARFQPTIVDGIPTWETPHHLEMFEKFMEKSARYANWGASYFDPIYKAIAVMAPAPAAPNQGQSRQFDGGNVIDLDPGSEYRRLINGDRKAS